MELKKTKRFIYEGLGFPVILKNISLVKKRRIWTPFIDYNKLQKEVILALTHKPVALTGNEIHFIRTYFEMTLESFGKKFGVTHVAVLTWEKTGDKPAKINPKTELYIRLLILEKLNMSDQIFREAFREFDIVGISKTQKSTVKPLILVGADVKSIFVLALINPLGKCETKSASEAKSNRSEAFRTSETIAE